MAEGVASVVGFAATLLGLVFTGWQAWQARSAAEAAQSAASAMSRHFSSHLLRAVLPELQQAETALRAARDADDHGAAVTAVLTWRAASGQARALLVQRGELGNDSASRFTRCAALAHDAEATLVKRAGTVDDAVDGLLREMGDLSMTLAETSVRILTEVPK